MFEPSARPPEDSQPSGQSPKTDYFGTGLGHEASVLTQSPFNYKEVCSSDNETSF